MSEKMHMVLTMLAAMSVEGADITGIGPGDLVCLADNVHYESRGESISGQIAVANVTMNRVASDIWPDSICEVVHQEYQFSWTLKKQKIADRATYKTSIEIAAFVLTDLVDDNTNGSHYFYNPHKIRPPKWTRHKQIALVGDIGQHRFYTRKN